ncbi:DNA/RNA non-specific endonuclease [Arenibacter certesii]|uniref:Endonuclease n=1 Tax=Arenibacter certesii TaxID=228955 RepID=A0A918MLS1_9FLAO|nr:DNA/RNA non-specific endonuclease [Arenibacter certesii]GGW34333.1 endonuclease [Arenibacter certesii]
MNKNRKNKIIYTALMVLCIVVFWWFDNYYTPTTVSSPSYAGTQTLVPKDYWPSSTTGALVQHNHYMFSYSEEHEQAEWVAYLIDKSHLTYDDRKRPYFIQDPKVKTTSADWRNYKGSGYERGHLCPAGDRRFSEEAYNETFYTSNISPQIGDFNGGIWNRLEQQIRSWAKREGPLVIITAGVLSEDLPTIGKEDVAVPKYFYKIVAKGEGKDLKIIAFLIPHKKLDANLKDFVVTVDQIEKLTSIDFFQGLPYEIQEKLESEVNTKGWRF